MRENKYRRKIIKKKICNICNLINIIENNVSCKRTFFFKKKRENNILEEK